jgi:hypothetical protein
MPDTEDTTFHPGEREMQERFDSIRLADAVSNATIHDWITDRDKAFIERMDMFFLATGDADGNLDCSYKGGEPGFVRVVDEQTVAFPHYDGNGMFMSSGTSWSIRGWGCSSSTSRTSGGCGSTARRGSSMTNR